MKLTFTDFTYDQVLALVLNDKKVRGELSCISKLGKLDLRTNGDNDDLDNFQIFTPRFIVDGIMNGIGEDNICDLSKRILEPTSGDGAFTCRMLELRLGRINELDSRDIFVKVLRSISTIYSIEMDKNLLDRQRNSMYTLTLDYLSPKGIVLSFAEDALLRLMIYENIIWAMTNYDKTQIGILCDVAFEMPKVGKTTKNFHNISIKFPVWKCSPNKISLPFETPEVNYSDER